MPSVTDLYTYLDKLFPTELSCDWDNDGMMLVPDPNREVVRVLCTLDVTDEAVTYAIDNSFDVIVSHHPMIFKPMKALNFTDPLARRIFRLMEHKISVLSFHTRLDAAPGGLNDMFAKLLGLTDVVPLEADGEAIGRVGTLPTALGCTDFAMNVKKKLQAERVLYATSSGVVSRVAICGGAGKDFVKAAKAAGADSYLTGELSYHVMEDADVIGLNLFEAGHFHTEDFISSYMTLLILKEFTQVQTAYYSSNLIKAV